MLILRSRTLIPRTRDLKGGPLLLLLDDASEAGGTRQTVVPTSQINPGNPLLMSQARLVRELPVLADYAFGTAHFN